jgi:pilus assembly protein TadC
MIREQFDLSTFFFYYMVAIFLSFLFFLIGSMLRHRRETKRLKEKFKRLSERPEQPWFEETE